MAKRRLNEKDIDQLLTHYRSERRRLGFQLELIRSTIAGLKKDKAMAPKGGAAKDGLVKRGPGRPRKEAGTAKPAGKPGRPKKRERKPRELNGWDNMVIDSIKTSGRLLPKEELMQQAVKWASKNEPKLSKKDVETYLTRTLQKLSGKKKLLGTHHSGLRRGNHYGLMEWFFQSSGKLRRQDFSRLTLTPKAIRKTAKA